MTRLCCARIGLIALAWWVLAFTARAQTTPGEEAEHLLDIMNWAGAAEAYQAVVREMPDDAQAWFRLGVARYRQSEWRKAAEAFEAAAARGLQESPRLAWMASLAYARLKNRDKAFSWLAYVARGGLRAEALNATPEFEALRRDERFPLLVVQATANTPQACAQPSARALDFWVGEWDVFDADRVLAGRNRIEKVLNGCALVEQWTGTLGDTGQSLTFFDPNTGVWRQVWAGDNGGFVEQQGKAISGELVLRGETRRPDGSTVLNRLTIVSEGPRQVRQRAESSSDGGRTWTMLFDFTYTRRAPPAAR